MRLFLIFVAGAVLLGSSSQAQAQPYYYSYPRTYYADPWDYGYVQPRVYYSEPRVIYSERYYSGDRRYMRHYGWDRGRHYGWRRDMVRVCRWRHHHRVCWWQPRRHWRR
jgi:hypothetical protein